MGKHFAAQDQRRRIAIAALDQMIERPRCRVWGGVRNGHDFRTERHRVIEVRYHDSVNVLQDLSSQHDVAVSPFDRAEWFDLLVRSGLSPLVASASHDRVGAAMVLTQDGKGLTSLRNWYSFTWRPFAPSGADGDRMLAEIAHGLKRRTHRVTLEPVPDEDGTATRLAAAFRTAGWRVFKEPCDTNHFLRVAGRTFDEYRDARPGPLRTTLKRKGGKVSVEIETRFAPSSWKAYEAIYAQSWKPEEGSPEMLRAFAMQEAAAGRMRLGIARHEGLPIAAQFWTVESGTAYIHKLAHLENHRHLSAGSVLSAAMFERVIDCDAVDVVDFGTGDDAYKRDWMEETRLRYRLDCINPASPRGWIDIAKRHARAMVSSTSELARRNRSS